MSVKQILKNFGIQLYDRRYIVNPRRRYGQYILNNGLKTIGDGLIRINKSQKEEILKFWNKFHVKVDMRWFDIYNTIYNNRDSDNLKYNLPHDIYYSYIDTYFSDVRRSRACDDKNMYDMYFHDIPQPKTVARRMNGIYMDANYRIISVNDVLDACGDSGRVVIKPSVCSEGGHGIVFWDSAINDISMLMSVLTSADDIIIQETIQQHDTLSLIHACSINTVRIMALIYNDDVHILSSVLRMGIDGSRVDNASSGGIFCGIEDDGRLKNFAYDLNAKFYKRHPQGAIFNEYKIPNFSTCIDIVKKLAPRLAGISKLCSWDLSIDKNGNPLLIEANMSYGGITTHQYCNGPLFGAHTLEILNMVFNKSKK